MKSILLVLILTTLGVYSQVTTNGVFVPIQSSGKPVYEFVGKGVGSVDIGKTYTTLQPTYVSTPTSNDTVTFQFSNGLVSKIGTNSNFIINDFQQELTMPILPSIPKYGSHNLSMTLTGEGVFLYGGSDSNSTCYVSTPLVDIELLKGKFYFRSGEKGVIVFVLDGSLRYHGERNRTSVVESGKAVVAAPIQFQMRGIDEKILLNTKTVKNDELIKLLEETKDLEKPSPFRFVVVHGELIGINMTD